MTKPKKGVTTKNTKSTEQEMEIEVAQVIAVGLLCPL